MTKEELEAILTSILDAVSDNSQPGWKDSLWDAAALISASLIDLSNTEYEEGKP